MKNSGLKLMNCLVSCMRAEAEGTGFEKNMCLACRVGDNNERCFGVHDVRRRGGVSLVLCVFSMNGFFS